MKALFLPLFFLLGSCSQPFSISEESLQKAAEEVACPNSESRVFDLIYQSLNQVNSADSLEGLKASLGESLEKKLFELYGDTPEVKKVVASVQSSIKLLLNKRAPIEINGEFDKKSYQQKLLDFYTSIEVGDQTTPEKKEIAKALALVRAQIKENTIQAKMVCPPSNEGEDSGNNGSNTNEDSPWLPAIGTSSAANIVRGSKMVIATAYQSCEALTKASMTVSTPDVQGILRVGTHPDGVGAKREISDLQALKRSHYYLKDAKVNQFCFDTTSAPLIYDYGGKPFTTPDDLSEIDLFRDAGSGTKVLGIDCSAFIFSSLATAGLKLHPDKKMKAILVNGVSSTMWVDPQNNGLNCFDRAKMGKSGSIAIGDIIAIPGHVFMIDRVGSDPLGLSLVASKASCSKLSIKNFDFGIAQSSPSKNGMGINRYVGKDYLSSTSNFQSAFLDMAQKICEAKFDAKDIQISTGKIQVARFSGNMKCQVPRIKLTNESCALNCR